MKKIILIVFIFIINFAVSQRIINTDNDNSVTILQNTNSNFSFILHTSYFQISDYKILNEVFSKITIKNYYPNNDVSNPELPVFSKIIEIPNNSEATISIVNYTEKIYYLDEMGYNNPIYPNQPWLSKNEFLDSLVLNPEIYQNHNIYQPKTVSLNVLGKFRGITLAQIIVNPFIYDISKNSLTLLENIEVEISFRNDNKNTITSFVNSPEFEPITKNIWNYSRKKDIEINNTPIKYLVIANRIFEDALQDFLLWKTQEGYDVTCQYTDDIVTSSDTVSDIKNYLQNLYNSADEHNPPPSYLLLVGDVEQLPTYLISDGGAHPSDLYYCCYDGVDDFIPEMYYGRLSAQNPEQLSYILDKIIKYEKCDFDDISFLQNATLIAGSDPQHGPIESNGQINYANNYYFNEAHDINSSVFLHPNSVGQVNEIITALSQGNSFVNYTAHCIATRWQNPTISSFELQGMINYNKPFFAMANCCYSGKYNELECIGETFVRLQNRGACSYIGASQQTYWFEDYFWSVGVRDNVIPNPSYEDTGNGVYDCIFHENGEEPAVNAGQIIFCGNMNVMQSSSTRKKYYWEVYNVLGDPSIMPYAGIPTQITANHLQQIPEGTNLINISTSPNAYVALSYNGNLIDAKYSNNNGSVFFNIPLLPVGTIIDIVITKQFHKAYFGDIEIIANNLSNDIAIFSIVEPINNYYTSPSSFSPEIGIINLGSNVVNTFELCYSFNETPNCKVFNGTLNQFDTCYIQFDEISLASDNYNFNFYISNNNDENPANDSMSIQTDIYAGNIIINEIVAPINATGCNQSEITPIINIKNIGNEIVNSVRLTCLCNEILTTIDEELTLNPNDSIDIEFPQISLLSGDYNISFDILLVNDGLNYSSNTNKNTDFSLLNYGIAYNFELLTDYFSNEVSWLLIDKNTNDTVFQDGNFYSEQVNTKYPFCFSDENDCYKFIIKDSWGDGMNANNVLGHFYIINENNDTILKIFGNEYTNSFEYEFCANTSYINDDDKDFISLFPNPVKEYLYSNDNNIENFNYIITDILGRQLLEGKNSTFPILVSNLQSGIYFVNIEKDGNKYIQKIIKE